MAGSSIPIVLLIAREGTLATPGRGEVHLDASHHRVQRNLAATVLARGTEGLPCGEPPLTTVVVIAGTGGPTLDDMLAATFASLLITGCTLPPGAGPFAKYAELARQGVHPGKVPLEQSIEGVFLAVRHNAGEALDDPAAAQRFLSDWDRMARVIVDGASRGVDPFTTPLFTEVAGFAAELAFLQRDRDVYRHDLANGQRLLVRLPDSPGEVPGLFLRKPRSLLFKEWARRDPASPGGGGYVFLAVQWAEHEWVFSTDPVHRIPIGGLAGKLQAAERTLGTTEAQGDPWFDGAPFAHTLVSSPERGTRLPGAEVLRIMKTWAHARPIPGSGRRPRLPIALGAVGAALVLAAGVYVGVWLRKPAAPFVVSRGAELKGEEIVHVRVEGADVPCHALIIAVSKPQDGLPGLPGTLRTAGALYHVLRTQYGYRPENMCVLADEDVREPDGTLVRRDGTPDLTTLTHTLSSLVPHYAQSDHSNFLFFYGGHGDVERFAKEMGYLVLSGYDHDRADATGYPMTHLSQSIQEKISCSHQLLLLDCCFSGYVQARGAEPADVSKIYSLWRERTHVVITAGDTSQASYDVDGKAIFGETLLDGIRPDPSGKRAPADADGDGIITDEELAEYLKTQVSKRAEMMGKTMTPQHMRGLKDDPIAKVGQFLLVPRPLPATAQ